jgi:FtsP/CotA-like multicopper oxidase with cupredoxin domain
MKVLIIFGLFLFSSAVNCQVNYDVDVKQYPGSLCKRDCNNAETRICYFHWTMEHYHTLGPACKNCGTGSVEDCYSEQCIPGDGTPRGVMSINRKFPSPNIHVCRNDLVVVDIMNAMSGTSASIHWHGFHMRQTPFYDGVPYVTQCPIGYSQTFRYTFWASEAGTQWYHSHSGHHKSNGQYGGIVVRKPDSEENHRFEYDYDLPEHLIIISDWMEYDAEMYVPGLRQSPTGLSPDNLLINGRGMKNIVSK